jgi:hypothetical protein
MDDTVTPLQKIRDFVRSWFDLHGIEILPTGVTRDPKQGRHRHELLASMALDYEEQRRAYNIGVPKDKKLPSVPKEQLSDAIGELCRQSRNSSIAKLSDSLRCTGEDLEPLRRFVEELTGQATDLDVAVLAHWIASVKRKMNRQPALWHLMPVLVGGQGIGKSTVLKHLLSPVRDVTISFTLDEMTDNRCVFALENYFVMVFDEMQGARKTEIEKLKNKITAEQAGGRPMRSNDVVDVQVNCMFIGTSNKEVALLVKDETGMRRFYELRCQDKFLSACTKVDMLAVWRGVDEAKGSEYLQPVRVELAAAQAALVNEDDVVLFVDAYGLRPGASERPSPVQSSVLYGDYKAFCEQHNYQAKNASHFGRAIASLGFKNKVTTERGAWVRYYLVSPAGKDRLKTPINEGLA